MSMFAQPIVHATFTANPAPFSAKAEADRIGALFERVQIVHVCPPCAGFAARDNQSGLAHRGRQIGLSINVCALARVIATRRILRLR